MPRPTHDGQEDAAEKVLHAHDAARKSQVDDDGTVDGEVGWCGGAEEGCQWHVAEE